MSELKKFDPNEPQVNKCFNPDCSACVAKRCHSEVEWKTFHPYRTHGYDHESGWSHPDLGDALVSGRKVTTQAL